MSFPGAPPEWPNFKWRPRKRPKKETIAKNTRVIRVIDHPASYRPESFNPRIASTTDQSGNRFDGTSRDPFFTCYVAMPDQFPHLAFWEVMQGDVNEALASRARYIPKTKVRKRAFAYLETTKSLM